MPCTIRHQGTILGPILFIIHINSLFNLKLDAGIFFYDDVTVSLVNHEIFNNLLPIIL